MNRAGRRAHSYRIHQRTIRKIKSWGYDEDDLVRNPSRPPGYEYWSRRPGPRSPGKVSKKITHSIERAMKRQLIGKLGPFV